MDNFKFVYELNRATSAMNSYIDARIGPHAGITRAQFVALLQIRQSPDITKAELARQLGYSHVAIGRQVALLVEKGYVQATPSKQNRHAMCLDITDDGGNMIEHVKKGFEKQSADLFAKAKSKVDITTLSAQLKAFADILSSYEEAASSSRR